MTQEPRSEPGHGTPEGHTTEEPAADELGQPGTPGAGSAAHHASDAHMDAHTVLSDDDHGHTEQALGPIDWAAWTYALVGTAAALVVVVLFWVAVT